MKKISRRRFLGYLGIGFVAGISGYVLYNDFERILFKILKKDLHQLSFDDSLIHTFIKDARENQHWEKKFFDWKRQYFLRFGSFMDSMSIPYPYKYKYNQYKANIIGDFLLSTDYFMNQMDNTKPLSYIGLYNPYKRACSNPFSNLYYP